MNKLIMVNHEPLTPHMVKRAMLDELKIDGIIVEYWDISAINGTRYSGSDYIERYELKQFQSIEQLKEALSKENLDDTIFMVECYRNWKNIKVNSLFNSSKCKCIRIDFNGNTILPRRRWLKFKYLLNINRLWFSVNAKLFSFCEKYKRWSPNIIDFFSSSSISCRTQKINHPDYETYLKIHTTYENIRDEHEKKYAVFLDEYFPLHPDLGIYFKFHSTNDMVKRYRDEMIKFFDFIEYKYNCEVIIASHPKAAYRGDEFGISVVSGVNRSIIKGKTANLISNSQLVINHDSTAFSWISLFDKPSAFVYTDDFKKCNQYIERINIQASFCGMNHYNLSRCKYENIKFERLPSDFRENYKYTFLTSPSTENIMNHKIVSNYIKSVK